MRAGASADRPAAAYRLGEWEVLPSLNRIRRKGEERLLEPKVMRVLQELAAQAPEVVPRHDLLERVWPGEYVTEHVLSRCISELRKALGDEARSPLYVETIRKGGYRLLQVPGKPAQQAAGFAFSQSAEAPTTAPSPLPDPSGPVRRRRALPLLVMAVLPAATVLFIWRPWNPPQADGLLRSMPLTSYPGSEVDPTLSPDGRLLAFSWDAQEGNFDIYLASLGASSARRLTFHPGEDKNPVFFPDGKRIAFVRSAPGEEGIYAVRWEGAGIEATKDTKGTKWEEKGEPVSEELLISCNTGDIPDLAVSPEGRYLYFSDLPAHGRPPSAIYRLDLATGEKKAVTRPPEYAFGDRDLALSHDGRRLAFARAEVAWVEELFVADLGSGRSFQVTVENESISGLTWTPDDREILFAGSRDVLNLLWRVPTDGGAQPEALTSLGGNLQDPAISTASGRLVCEHRDFESNIWLSRRLGRPGQNASEPEQMTLDSRLAPSTRWDIAPAAAADGRVAFISTRSGYIALWTCNPADGRLLRLTDSSLLPIRPAWSPDGRTLVFSDRSRGQADLIHVASAGGKPSRLTDSPGNEVAPAFSRDGRWVYFGSDRSGQWQLLRISALSLQQEPPPSVGTASQTGPQRQSAQVVASGGAIRGLESEDGRFLYFARHSRPGLWRKPLPDGPETLIAPGPAAAAWSEWTLQGDALYYLEHTATQSVLHSLKLERNPSPSAAESSDRTTSLPIAGRLYPGGGIALSPERDRFYLVRLDRSESDILMTDWPR